MTEITLEEFESEPAKATHLAEESPVRVVDPVTGKTVLTICIPRECAEDD